jgi:DNA-binding CsgD family transcriptional regulator
VVLRGASPEARRRAHRALGEALEGPATADLQVWHRAAAAVAPDEPLAAALEATAQQARERGGYAASERAWARAAELSPEPSDRARRLQEAAAAAHLAGRLDAALVLLDRAAGATDDEARRGSVQHLRGRIVSRAGSAAEAHALLVAEAERRAPHDPAAASAILAEAVVPCLRAGRPREACETGRRALALAPADDPAAGFAARLLLGMALLFTGAREEGAGLVHEAATLGTTDWHSRAYLGAALRLAADAGAARAELERLVRDARRASAPGLLPYALGRLGRVELEGGRWQAARAHLHEAEALAGQTGQAADRGSALAAIAWLDAAQGREKESVQGGAEALRLARELGTGAIGDYAAAAAGLRELSVGRPEDAIAPLAEVLDLYRAQGWSDASVPPHHSPLLVEASARAGKPGEARALVDRFADQCRDAGAPLARALSERSQGLVAADEAYDARFGAALDALADGQSPFELARTRLLYGERLRRAGRRRDARIQLRGALDAFGQLGAAPWLARAAEELRASGGTPRIERAGGDELTPQELQVALVVADGATNREAAARLFLSPKTVEFHLGRTFRKLGVHSRTELAQALSTAPPGG